MIPIVVSELSLVMVVETRPRCNEPISKAPIWLSLKLVALPLGVFNETLFSVAFEASAEGSRPFARDHWY